MAVYSSSSFRDEYASTSDDADMRSLTRTSGSFKLRTPHFSLNPRPWFDVEKERNHWEEVNARLKVLMNAKVEPDRDRTKEYDTLLRKDVAVANELDREVQRINAKIQSEPLVGKQDSYVDSGYSLLQTGTAEDLVHDWSFCSCSSGPNGTLVNPDRPMPELSAVPSVDLSRPLSLLQVNVRGRRVALARADECNCVDPWENYMDPSGSSMCSRNNEVTVCLLRRNVENGRKSPIEIRAEAVELMRAIDEAFDLSTYVPSATVNTTVEEIYSGASNITSEIGNWTASTFTNDTESDLKKTSTTEDLLAKVSGGGVPYDSDGSSGTPSNSTVSGAVESTGVDKATKIRWESSTGETVDEIVPTLTSSFVDVGKGNSFAELWRPFRYRL